MKGGMSTTILAALALLLSGLCLAVAVADDIRLPTDGAEVSRRAGEWKQQVGDKKRPWDCCDDAMCIGGGWAGSPPLCYCSDKVTSCSSACERCHELYTYNPPRMYRCLDLYEGDPGPRCKDDDGQTAANAGNN